MIDLVHPGKFPRMRLPPYPEIELAVTPWHLTAHCNFNEVDFVHVPTEGPLGIAARIACQRRHKLFSTAVHTKFPEYANILAGTPVDWGYHFLRWFHRPAHATMVQTDSQKQELQSEGLEGLRVVGGGVDTDRFRPHPNRSSNDQPILLFVGRVSKEKNIQAFLELPIEAKKIVVGDGPDRERLEASYSRVRFKGYLYGEDLVAMYQQADCLVFPSLTDTFGLTSIEAMACGTPVAAFPVTGPRDVVEEGKTGSLNRDLSHAVHTALQLDREQVRSNALRFSWERVADRFLSVHETE